MNYRQCLKEATTALEHLGISGQNAIFLMMEITKKEQYNLYLDYDKEVPIEVAEEFNTKLQRLLDHEPLQYVLGYEYFLGYQFKVNEDVLIPRDETQELVMNVLADIDEYFNEPIVVDIGCGSGAIAITLKKEEPSLTVLATDISETALNVAQENAKNLNAEVTFIQGDMLQPLIERNIKVDVLISNPPYIKNTELLEQSVVGYEPHIALFGGVDGLYFYDKILADAHKVLNKHSMLAFEIGYDLKQQLAILAKHYFPNAKIEFQKDLHGKDRMLFIYNL